MSPINSPPTLQSGLYSLQSAVTGGWVAIDQSQNLAINAPQPVVVVNPGINSPSWNVTQISSGAYELSLNGATIAPLDNQVFAFTDGIPAHNEAWEFNAYYNGYEWHYTIKASDNGQTWVAGQNFGDPITLVPVHPVPRSSDVLPEIPPYELFRLNSLD
ncbi:hypothetical protein C8Q75DRAFT_99273 [Abortiporus biennis]|nr:hypothetical protein C8Q75DRAFT_99273 [Abortiporus biennis]